MTQTSEALADKAAAVAKARFRRLTGVRLFGVVLALIGAAMMTDKVALPGAHLIGVIITIVAIYDVVVFPLILTRRWKREDQ